MNNWTLTHDGTNHRIHDEDGLVAIIPSAEDAEHIMRLRQGNDELREAMKDMLSGWKYIRQVHGDLYGVGWDRAQGKAEAALAEPKMKVIT